MNYTKIFKERLRSNKAVIAIFVVLVFFSPLQIYSLITLSPSQTLESNKTVTGADNVYYLDGALSVIEFNAELKFNNKRQPIFGSRQVESTSFPKYASIVALLYPYSSFKYGYSLSTAAVTAIIPKKVFENKIPRLAFSNFIFTFISLIALCLILDNLSFGLLTKIFSVVLVTLDPFLIQTNYVYQSHTVCGLMYLLILLAIFTSKNFDKLPFNNAFYIGVLFSLSALSSSHFVFLLIGSIILIFIYIYQLNCLISKKIKFILFIFIGASLFPLYILFVEKYIEFSKIGLNTFLSQNIEYARVVGTLVDTYSLFTRKIWSYEIWNKYIYFIIIIIFIGYFYVYAKSLRLKFTKFNLNMVKNNKRILIFTAIIFSFIAGSIFTQPLVRALVPELFIFNVLIGIALGSLFNKTVFTLIICLSINLLFLLNYYDFIRSIKNSGYSLAIWQKSPPKAFPIEDKKIIWDGIIRFHKNGGKNEEPTGSLGIYSLKLGIFVDNMAAKFKTSPSDIPDDIWIEINPMNIVEQYSHTRRFINQFNPNKKNIVTRETIEKDFRLILEIFKYIDSGQLSEKSYFSLPVWHYSPTFFDQEYNYIYGYQGRIKKYLKNTSLENIEFRKIYYVNLHDLSLLYTQLNN